MKHRSAGVTSLSEIHIATRVELLRVRNLKKKKNIKVGDR
jgi:hypothetical protein